MLAAFDVEASLPLTDASGAWHINFHDAHCWFVHLNRCQPVSSCHALFRIAISPLNRYTNSLHRDFYFPGNGAFSAIAELVGKRHDNVKRTIETLAKNGVIRLPQIEVSERINNLGFNVQYEHYVFEGEQGKRDSIVVVAQLSPEFTARLVDRWRELEEAAVNIPKTLPEALRLAADLAEQKMQLENQLAIAAPKVEFADRVGEASGILIVNFAKVVGIGPNKLFAWMRDHKILIASGSRRNVPMQEYMDRGYFTVKETAVNTNHGIQISFTTKITGRGQQWLTRKLLDNGMLKVTGEAA